MFKELIRPDALNFPIQIPEEFLNTEVEISIIPHKEKNKKNKKDIQNLIQNTAGIFKDMNIEPIEWQRNIRNEWEREN